MKIFIRNLCEIEKAEVLEKYGLNKKVIVDLIPISEYINMKDLGENILIIVDTEDEQYSEYYLTYKKDDEKYVLIEYKYSYFDEWDGLYDDEVEYTDTSYLY